VCLNGCTRVYPKVSGLSHNEISNNNNKHTLRSNTKCYGGKTHYTDSQNSVTTVPSGRELYTICSYRSRWPVRKLLDTPSYVRPSFPSFPGISFLYQRYEQYISELHYILVLKFLTSGKLKR